MDYYTFVSTTVGLIKNVHVHVNKGRCHSVSATLWLYYVFFDQQWSSVAQRDKLDQAYLFAILICKIDSWWFWSFHKISFHLGFLSLNILLQQPTRGT